MSNTSGRAYALTALCPITNGSRPHFGVLDTRAGESHDKEIRRLLQSLPKNQKSIFANTKNTYLARLFILNDVLFQQGSGIKRDQLKSKYLCFNANFHGELEPYLTNLWNNNEAQLREIWQHCIAFEQVSCAEHFIEYIKSCQVKTSLFFNGSNDMPVAEQLKALYVKQMFSEFALSQQGKSAAELKQAFKYFLQRVQLNDIKSPSWKPGQTDVTLN